MGKFFTRCRIKMKFGTRVRLKRWVTRRLTRIQSMCNVFFLNSFFLQWNGTVPVQLRESFLRDIHSVLKASRMMLFFMHILLHWFNLHVYGKIRPKLMQKASTGALRVLLNAHPATNPLYNGCPSISFFCLLRIFAHWKLLSATFNPSNFALCLV